MKIGFKNINEMDYTVFDVETANNQRASICSIGIIRYENNQVVYEKKILINPEVEFNYYNTRVHGIKASDVIDAPKFPEVWNEIRKYFDGTILVAHNAKSMDLCALYRTLERYRLPMISNDYICTLELAKEIFKNNDSVNCYKLNVLSEMYDIDLLHHHDALEDTRACFEILKKFVSLYPDVVIPQHYEYNGTLEDCKCATGNGIEGIFSENTKEMQRLQEIVSDIIEDNQITDTEIRELKEWLEIHVSLIGFYPFDKIYELVETIMLDGVLDNDEQQQLLSLLDAFINPQTENVQIDFKDKLVCLSGDFDIGNKKQVEDLLISKGASIAKSVTGKLDVLILGQAGSVAWKYGNYGFKYEKAQKLNEKGKNILIVKEKDVL